MRRTRTIRAHDPADLLAFVPCVLGFHPHDSLVLLTLGDTGDTFHARVDLPQDEPDVVEVARTLGDAVQRHGVAGVAVVAYGTDHEHCVAVVGTLHDELARRGASVAAAVRADGSRWYCLGDGCCPPGGTSYDLSSHPLTAQSVLDGQVVLGSREELAATLVGDDPEALVAVERAADLALTRFHAAARHPLGMRDPELARSYAVGEGYWVRNRVRSFLTDGQPVDADDTARMLVALVSIDVRDVAWAEMTRSNAAEHVRLWRQVLQRAPEELSAPPAALLGFAAWLNGQGALAWCAVERCHRADPDYRLAALLSSALANAISPSSWQPIPKRELALFTPRRG